MTRAYTLYGGELSYFTRKLEAAMIFYRAEFTLESKGRDNAAIVEQRSGTHQVPVLQTPENWMLGDTTPLLGMLDGRFPDRRMFPTGALGVMTHVVEEYFDEWIARTMVHYRWHYPESAEFASLRMAQGNPEAAARVRAWGPRACRATGTDSKHQQEQAEAEYLRILQALERQLEQTPYVLGSRPTAVDCIVLGGLRAHTYMDPDPKRVTSNFPRVIAWCEGSADDWDGRGEVAPLDTPTAFVQFVLDEMVGTYQPYVLANKEAQLAGAKAFHVETYGEEVSYLARPYPEFSRQMIVDRIEHTLSADERSTVVSWLDNTGLSASFGH